MTSHDEASKALQLISRIAQPRTMPACDRMDMVRIQGCINVLTDFIAAHTTPSPMPDAAPAMPQPEPAQGQA